MGKGWFNFSVFATMRIDPVALLKVYQLANLTITVVLFIFPMKDWLALFNLVCEGT